MAEFKRNQELDHRQLTESLSQLQSGQEILQEKVDATHQQIQQMMAMLQTVGLRCSLQFSSCTLLI
jgi:hypothetical protein